MLVHKDFTSNMTSKLSSAISTIRLSFWIKSFVSLTYDGISLTIDCKLRFDILRVCTLYVCVMYIVCTYVYYVRTFCVRVCYVLWYIGDVTINWTDHRTTRFKYFCTLVLSILVFVGFLSLILRQLFISSVFAFQMFRWCHLLNIVCFCWIVL